MSDIIDSMEQVQQQLQEELGRLDADNGRHQLILRYLESVGPAIERVKRLRDAVARAEERGRKALAALDGETRTCFGPRTSFDDVDLVLNPEFDSARRERRDQAVWALAEGLAGKWRFYPREAKSREILRRRALSEHRSDRDPKVEVAAQGLLIAAATIDGGAWIGDAPFLLLEGGRKAARDVLSSEEDPDVQTESKKFDVSTDPTLAPSPRCESGSEDALMQIIRSEEQLAATAEVERLLAAATDPERELLQQLFEGRTRPEAARALGIAPGTARARILRLRRRHGSSDC